MYEVFFNDNRLVISAPDEGKNLNKFHEIYENDTFEDLQKILEPFLLNRLKDVTITGDVEKIWLQFRSFFNELPAAGGLVTSDNKYLFIFRRGKWDLPKGKIDEGESADKAAMREVSEETGLKEFRIIHPLPSTWHIYFSKFDPPGSKPILKETRWFLMEAAPGQDLTPEQCEDIEEARWFTKPDLELVLANTYESLRNLINSLLKSNVI